MHIRAAQSEDYLAVYALMQELDTADTVHNTDERRAVFLNIIDDPSNHIFVGVSENDIVATCYLNIIPNITWKAASYALIENVVTSTHHRRKGYGRKCIKHAIEFAYSKGCFKIMLMSSQRDDQTRAFYGSVGLVQSKDGYAMYKEIV